VKTSTVDASTAELVAAYSSGFAAVGTVGAFVTGGVLLRREIQRDESRQEETRRAQASLVAAYTDPESRVAEAYIPLQVLVSNQSESPVYEACLVLPDDAGPQGLMNYAVGLVPGGSTLPAPLPDHLRSSYLAPAAVELYFDDAAGRTWRRDERGALHEVLGDRVEGVSLLRRLKRIALRIGSGPR
jgi:hypothetical protein